MSLTNQIKSLRQDRAKLVKDAGKLLTLASEEKRELTSEETQAFDKMHEDAESIAVKFERLERQLEVENGLTTSDPPLGADDSDPIQKRSAPSSDKDVKAARESAFENWCRFGMTGIGLEERTIMSSLATPITSQMTQAMSPEARAQSVGTDTAGGFTVPEGFQANLEKAQLQFSGVLEMSMLINTATGADLPWPTTNDTSNKGALLAENAQDSEQDVTFGATTLQAFMYTSKIVRVSLQLLQDSAFSMDSLLTDLLGERLGRILNEHGTTGTGSGQPNGVVTASTLGKTTASATAVTFAELQDLKHSVDPAYRKSTKTGWMFNDSTLLAIKQLVDGDSRPLWQAGIAVGEPDTLDGDKFAVNQDMASIATGNITVLYGDFSKYIVRRVTPVQLLRLVERYADFLQVGFLAFQRWDADLINAGTNPVKHLIQL